jgi:sec-independent protein translocase protein TatC
VVKLRSPFKGIERDAAHMSLADHLRELRVRLFICLAAVAVAVVPAWFLYPWLLDVLNGPYCAALTSVNPEANCRFLVTNVLDPFTLRLRVAGYGALFLALPVILWQLWRFIAPGLYRRERRYALAFTLSSLVLFAAGSAVAYLTLTRAVQFLVQIGGPDLETRSGPQEFVRLSLFMMLAFGAGFQFPVLVVALEMVGVVTPQRLASWRRQAILVIVIVAAAITPSGDPFSLFALAIPMYAFYELSILLGRLFLRRRRKAAERAERAERDLMEATPAGGLAGAEHPAAVGASDPDVLPPTSTRVAEAEEEDG